ncbi:hypothetical protein T4E_431, partial [Trichinella pseudospiralis]
MNFCILLYYKIIILLVKRLCLKEEKDYAEFKKEAVNFCSDWLKENRFVQNYGSFVGDALMLCTHTVYICISIAGESSWHAIARRSLFSLTLNLIGKR